MTITNSWGLHMTEQSKDSKNTFLSDVSDSLLDGLKPRISDPFLGVYIISFLIWNFQIFIFAFSSLNPNEKYESILNSLNYLSFLLPLAWVVLINFIFPKYLLTLYRISETWKIELSNEINQVRSNHITMSVIKAELLDRIKLLQNENGKLIIKMNTQTAESSQREHELTSRYEQDKLTAITDYTDRINTLQKNNIASEARTTELRKENEILKKDNITLAEKLRSSEMQFDFFHSDDPIAKNNSDQLTKELLNDLSNFLHKRNLANEFRKLHEILIAEGGSILIKQTPVSYDILSTFILKKLIETYRTSEFHEDNLIRMTDLGSNLLEFMLDEEF